MRLEADAPELEPPSPRGRFVPRRWTLRVRESAAGMFAPVRRRRVTVLAVVGAVAAVGATAAYSLLRVGGAGAFGSIWAAGGGNFLSDAAGVPVRETTFQPLNG